MVVRKVAVLDMNAGFNSLGLKNIGEVLNDLGFEYSVFDVRGKEELPDLNFDVYISTGGPGNPNDTGFSWYKKYTNFLDMVNGHNKTKKQKKRLLLICFSFQLACKHFKVGDISQRNKSAYGVYEIEYTEHASQNKFFKKIKNKAKVLDFRNFQVLPKRGKKLGKILAKEKAGKELGFRQAIMAYEFTPHIFGTQFHLEICLDKLLKKYKDTKELSGEFQIPSRKILKMKERIALHRDSIVTKGDFLRFFER